MDLYQRIRLIPDLLPETVTSWLRSYLLIQILPAQDLFFLYCLIQYSMARIFCRTQFAKIVSEFPNPTLPLFGLVDC
jgi:hypothetical protein